MAQTSIEKRIARLAEDIAIHNIQDRYYRLGLSDGYSASQVRQICKDLGISLKVLAARINMNISVLKALMTRGKVPSYIALLIYLVSEQQVNWETNGRPQDSKKTRTHKRSA
jgi:DNA-binding transcriptional regulator YiaG